MERYYKFHHKFDLTVNWIRSRNWLKTPDAIKHDLFWLICSGSQCSGWLCTHSRSETILRWRMAISAEQKLIVAESTKDKGLLVGLCCLRTDRWTTGPGGREVYQIEGTAFRVGEKRTRDPVPIVNLTSEAIQKTFKLDFLKTIWLTPLFHSISPNRTPRSTFPVFTHHLF